MQIYKAEVVVDCAYKYPAGGDRFRPATYRRKKDCRIAATSIEKAMEEIGLLGERFPEKYGNPKIISIADIGSLTNSGSIIDTFIEQGRNWPQEPTQATP